MPKKAYVRKEGYQFRENFNLFIAKWIETYHFKESQVVSQISDYVGVAPNTVNNWRGLDGRGSFPTVEQAYDIALYFRSNVQRMVTGEDPANIYESHIIRQIVDDLEI